MKKYIILLIVAITCVTISVDAKAKKPEQTVCYEVDIHCGSCKAKIEENIPFQKGVSDLEVNMSENTVTVAYNPEKTSKEKIRQSLEKLDFEVKEYVPSTKIEQSCGAGCCPQ